MSHSELLRFCADLANGALDRQAASFGSDAPDAAGVVRWANRLGYAITIEDLTDPLPTDVPSPLQPRRRPIVTGDFRFGFPEVVDLLRQAGGQTPRPTAGDQGA